MGLHLLVHWHLQANVTVHGGGQSERKCQLIQHLPIAKQKVDPFLGDAQFLSDRGLQEIHSVTEVDVQLEVTAC
jgi:hypothetical protein